MLRQWEGEPLAPHNSEKPSQQRSPTIAKMHLKTILKKAGQHKQCSCVVLSRRSPEFDRYRGTDSHTITRTISLSQVSQEFKISRVRCQHSTYAVRLHPCPMVKMTSLNPKNMLNERLWGRGGDQ